MSRILHDAVIQALKVAHAAFLERNLEKFREHMHVAECGVEAIRSLGLDDVCGRQMELMSLEAEITLLNTLPFIHSPADAIQMYEKAVLQMPLPPSRVIARDAPMLPNCGNPLDFFGEASDRMAELLEYAAGLYGQLTDGGGGGVSEIYRAQMAHHFGKHAEASHWAELALVRMCGDKWIEPIAQRLILKQTEV